MNHYMYKIIEQKVNMSNNNNHNESIKFQNSIVQQVYLCEDRRHGLNVMF